MTSTLLSFYLFFWSNAPPSPALLDPRAAAFAQVLELAGWGGLGVWEVFGICNPSPGGICCSYWWFLLSWQWWTVYSSGVSSVKAEPHLLSSGAGTPVRCTPHLQIPEPLLSHQAGISPTASLLCGHRTTVVQYSHKQNKPNQPQACG